MFLIKEEWEVKQNKEWRAYFRSGNKFSFLEERGCRLNLPSFIWPKNFLNLRKQKTFYTTSIKIKSLKLNVGNIFAGNFSRGIYSKPPSRTYVDWPEKGKRKTEPFCTSNLATAFDKKRNQCLMEFFDCARSLIK